MSKLLDRIHKLESLNLALVRQLTQARRQRDNARDHLASAEREIWELQEELGQVTEAMELLHADLMEAREMRIQEAEGGRN